MLEKENFKRVIFVWNYVEWGGAQIYFLSIIKNAPENWRFTIVLPANSKPELIRFFEPYGVEFDFIEPQTEQVTAETVSGKLKRQQRRIAGERQIYRHLLKYDLENIVIHIEAAPWQSWILLYLLTRNSSVFVTMHNALPADVASWRKRVWKTRLNFLLSQKNFHCFCANQNTIDSLKTFADSSFWRKLILTRASINVAEIEAVRADATEREELRRSHDLPVGKFVVLCAGQFIDRKGRWIFLESARRMTEINENIFFVWLTPQMPDAAAQNKIDALGLKNFRLILSEAVGKKRDEVLRFFRVADVFALPSLWEGLPIAVLEAMALGIPTVATNINAIPEAVVNMETGVLIPPDDAGELTAAVLKLFADADLRKNLAKTGKAFVLKNFDERAAARIALENYEKCLAN